MKALGILDRILGLLKWPIAFISLIFLPGMFYALSFVVRDISRRPGALVPLLVGAGAFVMIWLVVLRPKTSRHAVVTVEHELTHILVALLTLHRVAGIRAALVGGGHARYAGRGNWLIAIAPFVIPLFALVVMVIANWVHHPRAISGLLGFTLAWNVVGNWAGAHRHHGDHREAGRIFSFLFITCANLLVLGLVLAYTTQAGSLTGHLDHVAGPTRAFFAWIVKLLAPG
ncbi:MAG: M50 family metallopeptidase [Deltaproteobacteria bacterium]|nr:M50 family metallopeptidase [Deltaproteobacteria bacterium]MDQ3296440.1 M50 family metallopeptidase [Myxococcota bacterium]